uniref:non-specific serine/threonine protein kinase n=1 Tax=Esox lucius TaxID=8010 RepID=A0A6Q2YBC2_ESOLU
DGTYDSIYPTSVSHLLTSDKVAIKVLDKTRLNVQTQKLLSREISCMEALQHANIVRLYEVVESHSRLYLVLEYAGGGDLHTHICSEGRLSEPVAKITFAQILSAIKHMHAKNIIHRDLKAENVLYACNGCVKVADFGFSTMVTNSSDTLDTFCGSPSYAAPELFRDECYLGPPVDVWAMGVLLFFMVTGTMPFRADTMGKLRRAVIEGVFTLPPWVPGPCQRLIRGVLKPVPAERYAVDQMVGCDWLLPSVSGVTTFCLMQCNTSPSHRVDQVVDCGLWNVGPLLFNGCVKLLNIGRTWNTLSYTPIQSIPNMLNG